MKNGQRTIQESDGISTRRQILIALKKSGFDTLQGLSRALRISREGVRKHLALLEREGMVSVSLRRGGPGRPEHLYTLTEQADDLFPKHYDDLALDALEYIRVRFGIEAVKDFFDRQTVEKVNFLRPMVMGSLGARVEKLAALLSDLGGLVDWEKTEDGYLLHCYNCHITHIARRFPQACAHEREVFERLLGVEMTPLSNLARGDSACHYYLREPEACSSVKPTA